MNAKIFAAGLLAYCYNNKIHRIKIVYKEILSFI